MKKSFLSLICLLAATGLANAVPSGSYYDYRGVRKALVSDSGKTIYILDRDGTVRHELEVTQENSDGSFATRDKKTGIEHSAYKNAWFTDNGKVCLNVEWLPRTVTRE